MTEITIFLPKKRRNDTNKLKWKHNKHKKPFYLTSEINNAIHTGRLEKWVAHILFRKECYCNRYKMRRWK